MKARSDSLFKKLSEVQRDQLILFILTKVGGDVYAQGADLCGEWGIRCSRSAVHDFYSRHGFSWKLDRAQAVAMATAVSPNFEEEKRLLLSQKLFEVISSSDDPDVLIAVRSLEISADDLKLKERRVQLLEEKNAAAKKVLEGIKSKGGLSKETRAEIEEAARLL